MSIRGKKTRYTVASAVTVSAVIATGCAGNGGDSSADGQGGTLNVRIAGAMISTDPYKEIGTNPWQLLRQVYEGLVTLDDEFRAMPMLAASWDVSDDGLEYTFHLREDAKFHNGSSLTAADVVYSLNHYRENATRASQLGNIANVEAEDDATVVVTLQNPQGNFLELLGQPIVIAIVPEGAADDDGLVNNPVGTGPFKVANFANENRAVLEKFDEYQAIEGPTSQFGGFKEALVDEVVIESVTEEQTTLAAIETGRFDLALDIPVQDVERIDSVDGVSVESETGTSLHAMYIATASPVVDDPEIRAAIITAIDRERLLEVTNEGRGEIANSYVPEAVSWHVPQVADYWPYEYSPEEASAMREASAYDGANIEIIAGAPANQQNNATLIGQMLEAAGFTVSITALDHATYQSRLNSGDFQLAATGTPIRTPADLLYNEWTCNGQPKRFGYCNDAYDHLYAEAVSTIEEADRVEKFAELEAMLKEDSVISPWYFVDSIWAISDELEGVKVASSSFFSAWNVSKNG